MDEISPASMEWSLMFEEDMLPVAVVLVIFVLIAYDITSNNGEWTNSATEFLQDAWRNFLHLVHV